MRLRTKILLLAILPLLASLTLIALAMRQQERELARREHALVEGGYVNARRAELKHYVELGVSVIKPLLDSGREDAAARDEALRLLQSLSFGDDGYFFVYDLHGRIMIHPRQPDLIGQDL